MPDTPVTVVTGGSRGIGAATVRRLAAAGHDIALCYRDDTAAAETVLADIHTTGRRGIAVRADVTDPDQVTDLFDQTEAKLGTVTGLVNNAGVTSRIGPLVDLTPQDLRHVIDVNLVSAILCAQQAARRMNAGGAIVNVSSAAATLGSPGEYIHYAAAKAGVDALTIGLSKELGPRGIRVNGVAPGTVWTDIHTVSGDPDRPNRIAQRAPLGRAGDAPEIAHAIAWLLSPEASYATGTILRVAGGL
ncbi:SDR family oxidoreductase [Polymorphospora sp. NPDC051019]|uniref:SDR family NAD(P)-dependent oxidoreductase n=1 Tax=Polymorphospora sp. NPDC051019 TaxID=3155725 RepID=UPI0034348745